MGRFKRNGQIERGGLKKRGCDHRPTPASLKTMIIDGRRSKGVQTRKYRSSDVGRFCFWKNGGMVEIESIQRLIPMNPPDVH